MHRPRSRGEADASEYSVPRPALHLAKSVAFLSDHPGDRDRGKRGHHDGDARERRHVGSAGTDFKPGYEPADGATWATTGAWRGSGGAPSFKEADADAVLAQIGGVAAAAPEGRTGVTVVSNGRNWATNVTGSTNSWFVTGNWNLASGREFEDDEQRAGAAVC